MKPDAYDIKSKIGVVFQDVAVFEELTVAVDPQSRNNILDGIKKLRDNGATIVYTTHYMEEVEILCDKIIILDKGKIIATGTSDELKELAKTEENAKELLKKEEITGYLKIEEDSPKVIVTTSGINETVFKYVVEEITQTTEIVKNIAQNRIKEEMAAENYNVDYEKIYKNIIENVQNQEVKLKNINDTLSKQTEIEITSKLDTNNLSRATFYYNFMNYSILAGCVYGQILIANSFVFSVCSLTIAFLIANLINNKNAINGIINVVALWLKFPMWCFCTSRMVIRCHIKNSPYFAIILVYTNK